MKMVVVGECRQQTLPAEMASCEDEDSTKRDHIKPVQLGVVMNHFGRLIG